MKIFYIWTAFVLIILGVYLFYALPPLNSAKGAELWGAENKWVWYFKFCALNFLYASVVVAAGGAVMALLKRFF